MATWWGYVNFFVIDQLMIDIICIKTNEMVN